MKKWLAILVSVLLLATMIPLGAVSVGAASTGSKYTSNSIIAARIDEALSNYGPNSFFTKNGKACNCHNDYSFSCENSPSKCNCLRKPTINGKVVDLSSAQCLAYSRYWQHVLFGTNEATSDTAFKKLAGVSGSLTGTKVKNWFTGNKTLLHPGTHIRVYNSGHSITLLGVDYTNGNVTYIECNWTSQDVNEGNWCKISKIKTLSWSNFAETYATLDYAYVYKDYSSTYTDTPTLSMQYHANGGSIACEITGTTYKVTESAGLNMRKDAGTDKALVTALPQNTTFTVKAGDTKVADGYTWGKTTYNGNTGWVVISKYVEKTGSTRSGKYYLSSSLVYRSSDEKVATTVWKLGTGHEDGLYNATTFGLTRNGYSFVGWCAKADGSATVFDQNDGTVKAEDIYPELKNGSATVTLYAIWELAECVHDVVTIDGSKATCTEDGLTDGEECCVCGEILVEQEVIPALGHVYDDEYDADCNTCGEVREVPDKPAIPDLPADAPAFAVDSVTAREGEEFSVAIRTERNSGIVSFKLQLVYDAAVLELVSVEEKDFTGMSFSPISNNPLVLNWVDAIHPDNTTDGVVALLTFRVKEGASVGKTVLNLTYDPEDVYDQNFDNVGFRVENGFVEVVEYVSGDVNGDGRVNNKDLGVLQQYLNGWSVSVNEEAADVTGDGRVNNKDLGILQQYLNGWNVELK